jgi:16S rRNA (cytosine1402-N4)-methyltransferase
MKTETAYHIPVLAPESIDGLDVRPAGIYVDATFGGGGHSRLLLDRIGDEGRLYGFDQDADAEANALSDSRFTFVRSNFRFVANFMDWHGETVIDGLIADLGVSWHHFDDACRGFSFRFNAPLDMRMNRQATLTAADLLNTGAEEALADIFYRYGELRQARAIARAVIRRRESRKFATTGDLIDCLKPFFSREKEKKIMAQAFQALRIEVNDEMGALRELLCQSLKLLRPGGRIAVITYHSLEDRLVKNFLRAGNFEGKAEKDFFGNLSSPFRTVNNKPITPSEKEISENPRSRSAKLRIAEKI